MLASSTFILLPLYPSQYFQLAQLETPLMAGVRALPLLAGTVISTMSTGRYTAATGSNQGIPAAGMLVFVAGALTLGLVTFWTPFPAYAWLCVGMLVCGAGLGMVQGTVMVAVQNAVERSEVPSATSAMGFVNKLATSIFFAGTCCAFCVCRGVLHT